VVLFRHFEKHSLVHAGVPERGGDIPTKCERSLENLSDLDKDSSNCYRKISNDERDDTILLEIYESKAK
jgi:hypothetical protein